MALKYLNLRYRNEADKGFTFHLIKKQILGHMQQSIILSVLAELSVCVSFLLLFYPQLLSLSDRVYLYKLKLIDSCTILCEKKLIFFQEQRSFIKGTTDNDILDITFRKKNIYKPLS